MDMYKQITGIISSKTGILFLLIIGLSACISTKINSVNQEEYLGNRKNDLSIYKDDGIHQFYIPFDIGIKPMEKLMLISFECGSEYKTIELQLYNDERGKGAGVILYGKNGKNDFYCTDKVFADTSLFDSSHSFENKEMEYALNISDKGLNTFLKMRDKSGKLIEMRVVEQNMNNDMTSMLAPVGGIIEDYSYFPFFYLEDFNFVKQKNTKIELKIDGVDCQPKKIPIPMNGSLVYICQYSASPVISKINKNFTGKPLFFNPDDKLTYENGNKHYEFTDNDGHKELRKITCSVYKRHVGITFSPPIPNITNLKNNTEIKGKFSLEAGNVTGVVAGEYQINIKNDKAIITMQPLEAYSPMKGELWVRDYQWKAEITFMNNEVQEMISEWRVEE